MCVCVWRERERENEIIIKILNEIPTCGNYKAPIIMR